MFHLDELSMRWLRLITIWLALEVLLRRNGLLVDKWMTWTTWPSTHLRRPLTMRCQRICNYDFVLRSDTWSFKQEHQEPKSPEPWTAKESHLFAFFQETWFSTSASRCLQISQHTSWYINLDYESADGMALAGSLQVKHESKKKELGGLLPRRFGWWLKAEWRSSTWTSWGMQANVIRIFDPTRRLLWWPHLGLPGEEPQQASKTSSATFQDPSYAGKKAFATTNGSWTTWTSSSIPEPPEVLMEPSDHQDLPSEGALYHLTELYHLVCRLHLLRALTQTTSLWSMGDVFWWTSPTTHWTARVGWATSTCEAKGVGGGRKLVLRGWEWLRLWRGDTHSGRRSCLAWRKITKDPCKFAAKSVQKGAEVSRHKLDPKQREAMQAAKLPEVDQCLEEVCQKYKGIIPAGRLMRMRWVLALKSTSDPSVAQCMARIVLLGYTDSDRLSKFQRRLWRGDYVNWLWVWHVQNDGS